MRLNDVRMLQVEGTDLVLTVKVSWGELREMAKALRGLSELELLEPAHEYLSAVIVGATGLQDETGAEVSWSPELLNQMDPALVITILQTVMRPGEVANPTSAPSAEPPAS